MVIKILGNKDTAAYQVAQSVILSHGHQQCGKNNYCYHLAVAPLLTENIPEDELKGLFSARSYFTLHLCYMVVEHRPSNGHTSDTNQSQQRHCSGLTMALILVIYVSRKM